ncbi:MAG: glycosyltransferase [Tepidisphaeraceae bacterium]
MRALHVISSIDSRSGGPATALFGLASAQARAGLDVSVVSTAARGARDDVARKLREAGVAVTLVGPAIGPTLRHPALARTIEHAVAGADVVHIHALWEEIQHRAARTAQAAGVPYVVRPCGMLDPWSLSQSWLKKRLYMKWRLRRNLQQAAALHFTTETERDLTGPLDLRAPAIVEPHGVDLREFDHPPPAGTFRRRWPQVGNRRIVLFLSRIHPKKGLELLVPAFARLAREDVMLVIAGPDEGSYRASVMQMIARENVSERTLFTGMLGGEDRIAALSDADLFVLPSHQENFGMSVVEAMAAGTAVVISDQVNIHREVTAAGAGGVTPIDVDSLSREIKRWLEDGQLRADAGRRGAAFVRERFNWDAIARRWIDHYSRLRDAGVGSNRRKDVR